jgi:hypothetical protein
MPGSHSGGRRRWARRFKRFVDDHGLEAHIGALHPYHQLTSRRRRFSASTFIKSPFSMVPSMSGVYGTKSSWVPRHVSHLARRGLIAMPTVMTDAVIHEVLARAQDAFADVAAEPD